MKLTAFVCIVVLYLNGCATIPPDLMDSYHRSNEASRLLMQRHQQSVNELVQNWYSERIQRLQEIKKNEISKVTYLIDHPKGSGKVRMIIEEDLARLELQYQDAMQSASKWRDSLRIGYADTDNWQKVNQLNAVNLEWMRSFIGLNNEQRKLFKELSSKNMPFPSDFINDQTKKILQK
ncbi:MAG: hypothetical protein ACO29O_08160 [Chitinophagaceae bacterium]